MRGPTSSEAHGRAGRTFRRTPPLVVLALVAVAGTSSSARAARRPALPDAFRAEDLLWEITLGTHQYTIPIVDGGQLFVGINDAGLKHPRLRPSGGGVLMRLEPETGKMVWQMVIPRYEEGNIKPSHFNIWRLGVCSRPAIEGKRLYIVGPRGDVLCLDRNGQTDGNDGPYTREAEYMEAPADYTLRKTDGDIIWEFNMVREAGVVPHDACASSPLLVGEYLYACTSNGQDNRHSRIVNPEAPALIVLDKHTGRLVAVEAEGISRRTLHCNWSSPVAAIVGGEPIVLFGGGDGVLYAFKPVVRSAGAGGPRPLEKLWQYDCNPKEYRYLDGKKRRYSQYNNRSAEGPSEIISVPAVAGGRVYAAIGQSPMHGRGRGMLTCIDAATGKKVWESAKVDRTTAQPAVEGGLVYISDYTGRLHCIDADTGEQYWQHDLEAKAWFASPVVVDGKVYMSTERRTLWILKAGKNKQVLGRSRFGSPAITLMAHDGVLYLPTQRRLFAVK
ncbi:MAG: PQQ-binding-like beta-propeller repeat protein [Planctomycetota bacterium]